MTSRVLVLALAIAAGCGGADHTDGGPDMAAPLCPATSPGTLATGQGCTTQSPYYECPYADTVCACESGNWYCRSSACPPRDAVGQACTTPGLSCTYGFEDSCHCVAPENVWVCCGGNGFCPSNLVDGAPCCPPPSTNGLCSPGSCSAGLPRCACVGSHLSCTAPTDCDGGI